MASQKKESKERKSACIEIDKKKHIAYKLYAVKRGMKLKELAEMALDNTIKGK